MLISNSKAIEFLSGKDSLLDSIMTSFSIAKKNEVPVIEIELVGRKGASYRTANLLFEGIVEVGFYYSNKHIFYNIEAIKLLTTDDGFFYISLDPDETKMGCSKNDQDFVKARSITVSTDSDS